jgi:hypothetical protein
MSSLTLRPPSLIAPASAPARTVRTPSWRHRGLAWLAALAAGVVLLLGAGSSARADELNACGCSQSPSGECFCTKQAKCGCPGMCEPVGCAAKREKEFNRELEAETRRAAAGAAPSRTREPEAKRAAVTERAEAPAERPATPKKAAPLTAAQEKTLRRLLDAYLETHPEAQGRSLGEVRASLSASTGG